MGGKLENAIAGLAQIRVSLMESDGKPSRPSKSARIRMHRERRASEEAAAAQRSRAEARARAEGPQPTTRSDIKVTKNLQLGRKAKHGAGAVGAQGRGMKPDPTQGRADQPTPAPEEWVNLPSTLRAINEARSSTTFKKCRPGAMISTPYLRKSMARNTFINPDKKLPTWPIRSKCRSSLAGLGRALQFTGASEAIKKQVLKRVNALGGVRGKARIKLWGTGVGGTRHITHRGAPGKAKRHKAYGTSTGQADTSKHTPPYSPPGSTGRGEVGSAGNREVARSSMHAAEPPKGSQTKRKKKREAARKAHTVGKGQEKIGRMTRKERKQLKKRSKKEAKN